MGRFQVFFVNGLLLTGTSLVMRTVGVAFNAYITGKLGAAGTGLFSLVMSVYTLAVTFATSGVNLAATRMVAEVLGREETIGAPANTYGTANNRVRPVSRDGVSSGVRAVMRRCILYAAAAGVIAGTALFAFAPVIGRVWLSNDDTVLSLRVLAVSLPFIALSSAMSGYFNAVRRVAKNAASQVFEQFCKISLTVLGLTFLMPYGIKYACVAVVGGGCVAEALSCVTAWLMYRRDLNKNFKKPRSIGKTDGFIMKKLLGVTVPVALTAYVRSGLVTLEHILIPRGLRKNGSSYDGSLATYGVLSGMVFPIILYPSAMLSSFAGLLIPELAEAEERNDGYRIKYIAENAMRMAMLFSIGCAGVMCFYSGDLGRLVYSSEEAGKYISVLAPLIPVMYMDTTVDAMLKGLGEQLYSMRVNITDAFLSVVLVWLLVPKMGIMGYVVTVIICEIINAGMSLIRLTKRSGLRVRIVKWCILPALSILGASAVVHAAEKMLFGVICKGVLGTVLSIAATVLIYIVFLGAFGCVNRLDVVRFKLPGMKKRVSGRMI